MDKITTKNIQLLLQILALSTVVVFILFVWQGNKGFNLWDEGFLWYGVQRVMLGEVPIRDFMSYDPGRYYWSASLMSLWGDSGIMTLRCAVAVFQAFGLCVGLFLIAHTVQRNNKQNFTYLLFSAVTLAVWMFPRHKLFDISLSIMLIGILAFLIDKPTVHRFFITGFCIGLVAVFGRNHGMYGVAGSLGVMAWLGIKRTNGPRFLKGSAFWVAGVSVGYTPILLMLLLVPGFGSAFFEGIRFLLERGSTNLTLPVPWPWLVNFDTQPFVDAIREGLVGVLFIGIIAFGVISILWVFRQRVRNKPVQPPFVAAASLALPYGHFAFARADIGHLAQGVFPLLIGCLILLSVQPPRFKWPIAVTACAISLWVMLPCHPGWQCRLMNQCVGVEISGANIQMDPEAASNISLLRKLADRYAPDGRSFIVTPFWPGAYALLERKSPMWAVYALWARGDDFQQKEIRRIKDADPGFVLVLDYPLDGKASLRFMNTQPLIYKYIRSNFVLLPQERKDLCVWIMPAKI